MRGTTTQPPDAGMEATVEPEREWLEQRSAVLRTEQRQIRDRLAELKRERAD
jgi:chaperonin cofactor prefoldin